MLKPICKVLIVDDEVLVRQGIKYVLDWEQEGFQIVGEAANGREALDSLPTLQPHIILTDIVMPVMDGEEFTRLVKRDYPATQVIVLSSFSEFHYVRSTFQHGVADYILKPKLEAGALLQVLKMTRERIPELSEAGGQTEAAAQPLDSLLGRMLSGYRLPPEGEAEVKRQLPYEGFALLGWELAQQAAAITTISGELRKRVPGLVPCVLPGTEPPGTTYMLLNLPEAIGRSCWRL